MKSSRTPIHFENLASPVLVPQTRLRAFTLAELLVVICIIAVLLGLLFGAVSRVRTSSNAAKCLANLRSIGSAMVGYMQDHRGYGPPHYNYSFWDSEGDSIRMLRWGWMTHMAPYLGSMEGEGEMSPVFECPSDERVKDWPKPRFYLPELASDNSHFLTSYGYNYYFLTSASSWWPRGEDEDWPKTIHTISSPSKVILVTDGPRSNADIVVNPFSDDNRPSLRHQKRFNAVFLDGHVESLKDEASWDTQNYWRPQ
jgi:prepilin-type processing-associated H-X9-DG protein